MSDFAKSFVNCSWTPFAFVFMVFTGLWDWRGIFIWG